MSLTPAAFDALVVSGVTPEQLAAVFRADYAEREAQQQAMRAAVAERQRKSRAARAASRDVTQCHVTSRDTQEPAAQPEAAEKYAIPLEYSENNDIEAGIVAYPDGDDVTQCHVTSVTDAQSTLPPLCPPLDKENPPRPPKEINPPPISPPSPNTQGARARDFDEAGSPSAKPAKRSPAPQRTALPADWWPQPFGLHTDCRRIVDGWPPGRLQTEVERFEANHTAKASRFADWQAAWKTWVLNSRSFGNGNAAGRISNGAGPGSQSGGDGFTRALDRRIAAHRQAAGASG